MTAFVSAFSPVYLMQNVTYPVTETQMRAKEVEPNGSVKPSRELMIESTTYDYRGRMVMNQQYTLEVWA